MVSSLPAIVIDNGSDTTRAGFALEDLPSVVFNSNYQVEDGTTIVGDANINKRPHLEVMTLLENGLVYNFDHIVHNWEHAYASLDGGNGANASEHPLMMTEETWNTLKNKAAAAQIAFESLQVPLFSLIKTPLAQLYHMGQSSGLVIDVGASTASVTPILDGIIQQKSSFHTRYAGDFANLHVLRLLESKLGYQPTQLDYSVLMPSMPTACNLFRQYHVAHYLLASFKQTMLLVSEPPPGMQSHQYYQQHHHSHPPFFQLPNGNHIPYTDQELVPLTEPLFMPHVYKLPGVPVPEPTFDKAGTHGISNLVLFTLKSLESAFMLNMLSEQGLNANARFNEVLRLLFTNTLVTGGSALFPGFVDRLCGDLQRTAPLVLPNYVITGLYKLYISPLRNHALGDVHDTFDKRFGLWMGAATLASMLDTTEEDGSANIAMDSWFVSRADYAELGEDLVMEKFK